MIEQNQQIYGLILLLGYQDPFAIMVIENAIINQHQEVLKQEHKEEAVLMKEVKSQNNYAMMF